MAKNEPLCIGHIAFRLSDGTARRMSSQEFSDNIDRNADKISDICTAGTMNPCPHGEGTPFRSCETCNYNVCLDGRIDGMDRRFVHVDCPDNFVPEELCSCSRKTDLGTRTNIAVPFIEVRTGIVFQAIQGACAFYKTVLDVLLQKGVPFEEMNDFQYKSILDFKKGAARPKDYIVGRVEPRSSSIGGALRHVAYRLFHSWAS